MTAPEDQPTPLQQLAALVDRLGRPGQPSGLGARLGAAAPALRNVVRHQATWSRLRAEQRLRQAGAKVPAQAGPLHSAQVVYRTLLELHQLSPAYLEALLTQVDAMLALEQASGVLLPTPAAQAPGAARGGRPAAPARKGRRPAAPPAPVPGPR
jgi:hypothetical protein